MPIDTGGGASLPPGAFHRYRAMGANVSAGT